MRGVRELRTRRVSGFTPEGGIAIITNQLGVVARTLIEARNELIAKDPADTDYAQPSVFVVNGLLCSAATGLQSVLDSVASFCHKLEPDDNHEGFLYFHTYQFRVTTWEFIRLSKERQIQPLIFDGVGFNDLANRLKHELPWLGMISEDTYGLRDIRDGSNGNGTRRAVFREMLIPMYKITKGIIQRLGSMHGQPITLPHV